MTVFLKQQSPAGVEDWLHIAWIRKKKIWTFNMVSRGLNCLLSEHAEELKETSQISDVDRTIMLDFMMG